MYQKMTFQKPGSKKTVYSVVYRQCNTNRLLLGGWQSAYRSRSARRRRGRRHLCGRPLLPRVLFITVSSAFTRPVYVALSYFDLTVRLYTGWFILVLTNIFLHIDTIKLGSNQIYLSPLHSTIIWCANM